MNCCGNERKIDVKNLFYPTASPDVPAKLPTEDTQEQVNVSLSFVSTDYAKSQAMTFLV